MSFDSRLRSDLINYASIKFDDIPPVIYNYLDEKPTAPFIYSVKILQNKLKDYDAKSGPEKGYKYLYLMLTSYYLKNRNDFFRYYRLYFEDDHGLDYNNLITYLKYDIIKLDKILILVSVNYHMNNNYYSVRRDYPNVKIKMIENHADIEEIFSFFEGMNQVILVGHGGHQYIKVGNKRITEEHFRQYVNQTKDTPDLLGIFSCDNLIKDDELKKHFNFYITDEELSFPGDVECFVFNYLKKYRRTNSVQEAFWAARIAPFLRTRGVPPFKLYENGVLVS